MKTLFNNGWSFAKTKADDSLENDWNADYKPVDIPHDWLIYNAKDLYETSFGRYVKTFDFGKVSGKSIRLYFEGVYMDCTVYVNGEVAGENKYGYSTFEVDLTDKLHDGENEIKVLVRHRSPNSRWYSGAGIFRDIYLIVTEKSYLATDGVYFHTDKTADGFDVKLSAEVVNPDGLTIEFTLSKDDDILYNAEISAETVTETAFSLTDISDDHIWDIDSPNLLTLSVALKKDGKVINSNTQKVGCVKLNISPTAVFTLTADISS